MSSLSHPSSLLTAVNAQGHIHLILGAGHLTSTRVAQSLGAGAKPVLVAPDDRTDTSTIPGGNAAQMTATSLQHLPRAFTENDLFSLGRPEIDHVVDAVFITSNKWTTPDARFTAKSLSSLCKRHRIPVNVVDAPSLCTFSLLSVHSDGPLQVGVTTNGMGCKLAGRIRREISAALPSGLGAACARLGAVRRRLRDKEEGTDDSVDQMAGFNALVREEDAQIEEAKTRRMRWLGQVCEYWPLRRLAEVKEEDVEQLLEAYNTNGKATDGAAPDGSTLTPDGDNPMTCPMGLIFLAGSGPGHPSLLTRATHTAIQIADVILADKLVPAPILELIPRRTPVHIARKYPGNAERAQFEISCMALAALREGKTVLRLKQGDPYLYGRGGEEVRFFVREHGVPADRLAVLPGVTSALSAPLLAGIPPTMRDVADQVLICTGTGKKGKPPAPPEYVPSRTVIFLMALHRIDGLVAELTMRAERETGGGRVLFPAETPCCVVERASCADQRVVRTTLQWVGRAIEMEGSRPPGLLVVGWACEALWRGERREWVVEEGLRGPMGLGGLGGLGLGSGLDPNLCVVRDEDGRMEGLAVGGEEQPDTGNAV